MSEDQVVGHLIGYTDTLLLGVSLLFTVVSAYVAALNYFVRRASLIGRFGAFVFFLFIFALLCAVLWGAQSTHAGLIAQLQELQAQGALSTVGRTVLANAVAALPGSQDSGAATGMVISIDRIVMAGMWGGLALTVLAMFILTFVVRWGEPEEGGT